MEMHKNRDAKQQKYITMEILKSGNIHDASWVISYTRNLYPQTTPTEEFTKESLTYHEVKFEYDVLSHCHMYQKRKYGWNAIQLLQWYLTPGLVDHTVLPQDIWAGDHLAQRRERSNTVTKLPCTHAEVQCNGNTIWHVPLEYMTLETIKFGKTQL